MVSNRRDLLKRLTGIGVTGLGASLAGCAGDGPGSAPTETMTDPSTTETPSATPTSTMTAGSDGGLSVRTHSVYGDLLVDSAGRTLYVFGKDSDGESVCYDDCASAWPPLTVEGESGIDAGSVVTANFGTTEREDGSLQVTADGKPLYYFAQDESPGDANGMGIINAWFLVRPDGSSLKPTVSVTSHDTFGEILIDGGGRTLYLFTKDSDGESVCYDGCASAWPPLTVENEGAVYPAATVSAPLGTTERKDGSLQITANETPLYYFASDEKPGDVKGQGVNDVWFVLRPDGSTVTTSG